MKRYSVLRESQEIREVTTYMQGLPYWANWVDKGQKVKRYWCKIEEKGREGRIKKEGYSLGN